MFKKLLVGLFITINAFSAANVTTIPGATAIQYYFRNYTYANMSLDLPILSMGLATDLNKIVYRNSIGNLYKVMVDASGSSNTPQNRVFYADINGSATASTNFTFNGTDLYINSSAGSSINTGKLRLVDSLKAATGSFTNLTSGYIPYQNSTGTIINGPIFTNGTNAALGKSSVEAWAGTQRAFQIGGSSGWMGIAAESGTSDLYGLNNLYFDGAWKPYANGTSARFHFGSSGFLFAYDTGVVADVGFMPTSRFSWTLAGGLNVASKGTFTNITSGDTVSAKKGIFDSLKLDGGSYLKNYLDTTFYDSLYQNTTYLSQRVLARIVQVGKVITLYQPAMFTTTTGGTITIRGLPSKFYPPAAISGCTGVFNNGGTAGGFFQISSSTGNMTLLKVDGQTNLDAGTSGAINTCFTWIIN